MRPGLLRSFTHVIIRHGRDGTAGGATGGLYQWRDGKSRAFTPGWAPEGIEPAPMPAPNEPRASQAA